MHFIVQSYSFIVQESMAPPNYSGVILESESKPSTGFGGSSYREEVKTVVFLC